jgi:hypothetical protein
MFDFPKVKNPPTAGDDRMVTLNVYATNVSNGFPGVKIAERTAKYVNLIRPAANNEGTYNSASSTYAAMTRSAGTMTVDSTNNQYTVNLPTAAHVPNTNKGDVISIDLDLL